MTSDQEFIELAQSLGFDYDRREKCIRSDSNARWRLDWDSIAFFCKHPGFLSTRLVHGAGCRPIALDVTADTEKCPLLTRKMLEVLSVGVDSEQLGAYMDFIQLAACSNSSVAAKMEQWIIEFYPALNAWLRPHIIASFPRIISRLEVVEDLLLKNVANHNSDLVGPSLEALISLGSKRLEAVLSEESICAVSATPGLAGKLLASLPKQASGPASRIALEFGTRIETLLPKPPAGPSVSYVPHPGKRVKVGKDATKWADDLAEFVLTGPDAIASAWPLTKDTRVDILVLAMCACLGTEKGLLKRFVTAAINLGPELLRHCLLDLFPVLVKRLDWFRAGSPKILLALFSKSLQKPETPHHIARLFFESHFEEQAKVGFIHHLSSHVAEQTDNSAIVACIDILDQCATNYPASRHVCFLAFKVLVDSMQSWSIDALRKYYSTYARMARSSESVLNELILLVKKQIYTSDVTFKQIGAIAVTKFVAIIGSDERNEEDEVDDLDGCLQSLASCSQKPPVRLSKEQCPGPSYHFRLAISMLEEAARGLISDCSCFAIFLGELFRNYRSLASPLQQWISDWANALFQETFICEATGVSKDQISYDLDNNENPVCIDLGGALDRVRAGRLEASVFNCVHLLFLIVQEAERVSSNSIRLSAIDALQGCPLRGLIETDAEGQFLVDFAAVNLFRETFNAFGQIRNESAVIEKNVQRLKDIMQLTRSLQRFVVGRDHQLLSFKIIKDYQVVGGTVSGSSEETEVEDQTFINSVMPQVSKLGKTAPASTGVNATTSRAAEATVCPSTLSGRSVFVVLDSDCLLTALKASGENLDELAEFILSEIEPSGSASIKLLLMLWPTKAFGLQFLRLLAKSIQTSQASQPLAAELIRDIQTNCECFFQEDCQPHPVEVQMAVLRVSKLIGVASLTASDALIDQVLAGTWKSGNVLAMFNEVLADHLDSKSTQDLSSMTLKYFEAEDKTAIPPLSKSALLLCRCLLKRAAAIFKSPIEDLAEGTQLMAMVSHLIQYARMAADAALLKICMSEARIVLEAVLQSDLFGQLGATLNTTESQETRSQALEFVKTLQQGTRSMQIICNHLKYSSNGKSGKSTTVVAATKRTLEALIFKAKAITEASHGAASFWVGNLKHRDLEGQELCSQVALVSLKSPTDLSDAEDSIVSACDEEDEETLDSAADSDEVAEDDNDSLDDLLHSSEL